MFCEKRNISIEFVLFIILTFCSLFSIHVEAQTIEIETSETLVISNDYNHSDENLLINGTLIINGENINININNLEIGSDGKITYHSNMADSTIMTLSINVENDFILDGQIDFSGKDGSDGNNANYKNGENGDEGLDGKNIAINVDNILNISGLINVSGGDGGDGGNGRDYGDFVKAGRGGHGSNAANGGYITLDAKKIYLTGNINSNGGKGGDGGNGAHAGGGGEGGDGGDGGNGGNAGLISVFGNYVNISGSIHSIRGSRGNRGRYGEGPGFPLGTGPGSYGKYGDYGNSNYAKIHYGYGTNNGTYEPDPPHIAIDDEQAPEPVSANFTMSIEGESIGDGTLIINNSQPLLKWKEFVDYDSTCDSDSNPIPSSGLKNYEIYLYRGGERIPLEEFKNWVITSFNYKSENNQVELKTDYYEWYTYDRTEPLDDGEYHVQIKARDNNYNLTGLYPTTGPLYFTIDTMSPGAPAILDHQSGDVTANEIILRWLPSEDLNGISSYIIEIYDPETEENLYETEFEVEGLTADENGNYSYLLSDIIIDNNGNNIITPNSEYNIRISAKDIAGNESDSGNIVIVTSPVPSSIETFDSGWDQNNAYFVELGVQSVGSGTTGYRFIREKLVEGNWEVDFESDWHTTDIASGEVFTITDSNSDNPIRPHNNYKYYVETKNSTGDIIAKSSSVEYTVENQLPAYVYTNNDPNLLPSNNKLINTANITFQISQFNDPDQDELTYNLYVERYNNETEIWQNIVDELEGLISPDGYVYFNTGLDTETQYRWFVEATDEYGGSGSSLDTSDNNDNYFYFTLDRSINLPDFIITGAVDTEEDIKYISGRVIYLQISNIDSDINNIKVFENGIEKDNFDYDGSPNITHRMGLSDLEGDKVIKVEVTDQAGNTATKEKTIIYDVTNPDTPINVNSEAGLDRGEITLIWDNPVDPGQSPSGIKEYLVRYNLSGEEVSEYISGTNYTADGISDNQLIKFDIQSVDNAGNISDAVSTSCYSFAETANITGYSFDGHNVTLNISDVNAHQYKIKSERIDQDGNIISLPDGDWKLLNVDNLEYNDIGLEAHGKYNYYIQTRNTDLVIDENNTLEPYTVSLPNQEPTPPVIEADNYQYSNNLLLSTIGSTDIDGDSLTYYFTIKNENNNILVERAPTTGADGLSYQVTNDIINQLESGDIVKWQVFVTDGYMKDDEGEELYIAAEEVITTFDKQEPTVTINTIPEGLNLSEFHSSLGLNFTVEDDISGLKSISYYWNQEDVLPEDRDVVEIAVNSLTDNQFTITNIDDGTNNLHIEIEDIAGNINYYSLSSSVDSTAPEISSIEISGQTVDNVLYTTNTNSITAEWEITEDYTDIEYYRIAVITDDEINNLQGFTEDRFIRVDGPFARETESYKKIVNQLSLVENETYHYVVEAVNTVGLESKLTLSSAVIVDSSSPVIANISLNNLLEVDGKKYLTDLGNLSISVDIDDSSGIGIDSIEYALSEDISPTASHTWYSSIESLKSSAAPKDGNIYYLIIKAKDKLLQESIAYSEPIIIDQTPPLIEKLIVGNLLENGNGNTYRTRPGSAIPLTFNINDQVSITDISYSIGITPGDSSITEELYPDSNGWVRIDSLDRYQQLNINDIISEGTYYINLKVENIAGLTSIASTNQLAIDSQVEEAPVVNDGGIYSTIDDSLAFSWSFNNPVMEINQYEYKIVKLENNQEEIVVDWSNIPTGNDRVYEVSDINLTSGETYYIKLKAQYADMSYSGIGVSDGITIDTTDPINVTIDDMSYTTSDKLYLRWHAEDPESGIDEYKIKIGSKMKGDNILAWTSLTGNGSETLTNLSLPDDPKVVYYVTLSVSNGAGKTIEVSSDGFMVDDTPPPVPVVNDRLDYIKQAPLNFNWSQSTIDPESGLENYKIALLTNREAAGDTEWIDVGKEDERDFLEDLEEGQWYYLAVRSINKAGLESAIGYSDGILIDSTAPDLLNIEEDKSYLEIGENLTINVYARDQESGIDYYEYAVGTLDNPQSVIPWRTIELQNGAIQLYIDSIYQPGKNYFISVRAHNQVEDVIVYYEGTSNGFMVVEGYPVVYGVEDSGDFTPYNDQLAVSWQCDNTGYAPIKYYQVDISTDGTSWTTVKTTKERHTIIIPQDMGLEAFVDGETYYMSILGINDANKSTPVSEREITDGIKVDNSPPDVEKLQILHPHQYTTENYKIHLLAKDSNDIKAEPHSGISAYQYALGTVTGASDISNGWQTRTSNAVSFEEWQNFSFGHKERYYLSFRVKNGTNLWSEVFTDEGIVADITPPEVSKVESKKDYVTASKQIVFDWAAADDETGITEYKYKVVENMVEEVNWSSVSTIITENTSGQITKELEDSYIEEEGKEYKIAFTVKNTLGVWSQIEFSQVLTVDTLSPTINSGDNIVTNGEEKQILWQINEIGTVELKLFNQEDILLAEETIEVSDFTKENNYSFAETTAGMYRLELTAKDLAGNETIKSIEIRVNAAPTVTIEGKVNNSITVYKARELVLSAVVNDPDGANEDIQYLWDFGDGSISTEKAPVHSFANTGDYTVSLTCTDSDTGVGTDTVQISVSNTLSGELASDEKWSDEMVLKDTVIVPEGVSLTIEAGTNIKLPAGKAFKINGSLLVNGTQGNQVTLSSINEQQTWQGIIVSPGTGEITLEYAIIENAVRGITLNNRYADIRNSIFRNNQAGIHLYDSSPLIENCQIINNEIFGIKEDGECEPILNGNLFSNNIAGDYYDSKLTVLSPEELEVINND